jgi:plasmid stability protein
MDVLLRGLSPETKAALVERARRRKRSLQSELLDILERAAAEPVAQPPEKRTLHLVNGRSQGASLWSRDEIYGTGR